jgi:hypothetical protein
MSNWVSYTGKYVSYRELLAASRKNERKNDRKMKTINPSQK